MEEHQRVLIVDDERVNIKVLVDLLKPQYKIMVAANGVQALKAARSVYKPDLILLDIMMPEMNGYEFCRQLKKNQSTSDIPIIFITAMSQEDNETKAFDLGAVDYITKPIRPAIVLARVKTHLDLKKQRDVLSDLSSKDGLTGIANRRRFDDYLGQEWHRSIRHQTSISLIMMDIDHFKLFNDNYGHAGGDDCLIQIADAISNAVKRPQDLVARFGGEEFVCVLPDTDNEGLQVVGDAILDAVRLLKIPHLFSKTTDILTLSLGGVSVTPDRESSPQGLIEAADKMLYQAKDTGRNRFIISSQ